MFDKAQLINQTITYDSIGQAVKTETTTDIPVEVKSVSRSEWFDAGRNGLKPAHVLKTRAMNYNGQVILKLGTDRYSIYRTYQTGDFIELYVEKES